MTPEDPISMTLEDLLSPMYMTLEDPNSMTPEDPISMTLEDLLCPISMTLEDPNSMTLEDPNCMTMEDPNPHLYDPGGPQSPTL